MVCPRLFNNQRISLPDQVERALSLPVLQGVASFSLAGLRRYYILICTLSDSLAIIASPLTPQTLCLCVPCRRRALRCMLAAGRFPRSLRHLRPQAHYIGNRKLDSRLFQTHEREAPTRPLASSPHARAQPASPARPPASPSRSRPAVSVANASGVLAAAWAAILCVHLSGSLPNTPLTARPA